MGSHFPVQALVAGCCQPREFDLTNGVNREIRAPREALINCTCPLRVLKRADARRAVQPIVVLLASSATQQMHA